MTGEAGMVGNARVEVLGLEYLAALRRAVDAHAEPSMASSKSAGAAAELPGEPQGWFAP
jgi:hypothetical protein